MQTTQMHLGDDSSGELAPGTALLHGQYIIERYLVRGGFGITYLARDSLERRVVIKECFPNAICDRKDGMVVARSRDQIKQFESITRHFLREARRLSRLSHPNIVGVHQVFEENNTAYMALDYLDGIDLLTVIDEEPERLTPDLIQDLLQQALRAVQYIHDRDILHRDISPDNFLLDWDNNLTLIDFGAAREHVTKTHRALSALLAVKDGYSPQEFYLSGVGQSRASDLYALGATFYHVLMGEAPPHSQDRLAAIASDAADPYQPLVGRIEGFPQSFLKMIDQALQVFPEERPQSAVEWLERIEDPSEEAPEDPKVDLMITRTISQLVEDTNRGLERGQPGTLRQVSRRMAQGRGPMSVQARVARDENLSKQPVDIFGNPIEDVDKWLREQERGRSRSDTTPVRQDPAPAPPARSRLLRMLINRLTPASDDEAAARAKT